MNIDLIPSRFIATLDVPEPKNIRAKFNYNFFVKNEKTDRSGRFKYDGPSHLLDSSARDPDGLSQLATVITKNGTSLRSYEVKVPREIEISFDAVNLKDGLGNFNIPQSMLNQLKNDPIETIQQYGNLEENITTPKDVICKITDTTIRDRLSAKLKFATNIIGVSQESEQIKISKLVAQENFNEKYLDYLLGQESGGLIRYVNAINSNVESEVFKTTKMAMIDATMDVRYLRSLNSSFANRNDFNKIKNDFQFKKLESASSNLSSDTNSNDSNAVIKVFENETTGASNTSTVLDARIVGYLVYKNEITANGTELPKKYFINVANNPRANPMLDDREVVYGSTYIYNVRTVIVAKHLHLSYGDDAMEAGNYAIYSILVSRESETVKVEAIESAPPNEPDAIFYNYIYGNDGLQISWRLPTNRQRDVKYIQVFRRRSIAEPFQCIAELDFDDSEIKSPKTELVDPVRVLKFQKPVTHYIDNDFNRNSNYIYALASVDAHGMTSGYSKQMQVRFDRISNSLFLKPISRSGAPKQYPNFYVDPSMDDNIFIDSMTVDSMRLSRAKKLKIYFDPDARSYKSNNNDNGELLRDQKTGSSYKLHLINLDRQKDQILNIAIETTGN